MKLLKTKWWINDNQYKSKVTGSWNVNSVLPKILLLGWSLRQRITERKVLTLLDSTPSDTMESAWVGHAKAVGVEGHTQLSSCQCQPQPFLIWGAIEPKIKAQRTLPGALGL